MNKNMTEEEIAYYKTLSKSEKIAYTLKHKSKEDRDKIEKKRQESRNQWDDDYKKQVSQNISNGKRNMSEENKEAQWIKFRQTLANKSEEQKEATRQKRSLNTKKQFEIMSDSEKAQFAQQMSDIYHQMSDEQKEARVQKIQKTKRERYGDSYNKLTEECKQKMRETNLERYGVPYFCMTDSCRSALGGNSANSKPNLQFKNLLKENGINYDCQEFVLGTYSYDFKINDSILIEINPSITHNSTFSPFGSPKDYNYHYTKSLYAIQNGYQCINVWDWDDIGKIIELLKKKKCVQARKCVIKEVSAFETKQFVDKIHLQGYANSQINVGLYWQDELISIMTFGKPRYNKNYEWELIRYCSKYAVTGGAQKLFKYFIRTYNPNSIISYCDKSKFEGKVYSLLGFVLNKRNVAPSKHWYNPKTKTHITDNLLRQRGFDQLFNTAYGKGTSNEQLMLEAGFLEIYDCGQDTFVWKSAEN